MLVKSKMNAAELGALWTTYHKKTMILRILEHFISKSEDQKAKDLMSGLWEKLHPKVIEITKMLENDGAVPPIGFSKEDVTLDAPKLYENGFDIMFCRILKEISMGMYVLHMTISYREDIVMLYKQLTDITQSYYNQFTQYLLEKDLLPRPNYTNMPKSVEYITDKAYMKGTNLFGHKRSINTVEFGLLYHSIEANISGMQLLRGFAQCAKDEEVKKYFTKGQELSKEILKETTEILLQNNIQPPSTPGGTVTNSTNAPFSEKLMMYCTYLLGGFSLGAQGFNSAFVLRNDMIAKTGVFAKDVFEYTMEGAKLMMSKGWLEEPPEMDL
ncbi:DUF3231 family protein [Paenibacillus alginolyticus]|uniref:DUF3231 family protein n=1 Tax=Paenibacillus alginolyticus TaxID=59839 RepID=A0ABT4G5T8_9BACL|nr:DUF3231 family protein [Paenibacillus alginolyticus]MCY9691518.1 DUF3231 family protein [Paenibacillus alginolyticus]MEC0148313.1 DUF3231 family protein [Paenibacillus alginolyticus]